MTFKHKTHLLKSNYSTKNKYYRKRYAGTFMLDFTENPIQFQIQGSRKSGILVTGLQANLEFRSQFVVRPEAKQEFRI